MGENIRIDGGPAGRRFARTANLKRGLLISVACGLCVAHAPANAQTDDLAGQPEAAVKARVIGFNIPAQDLERALFILTRQASVQLVANPADIRNFESAPVVGSLSPDRATGIMLGSLPLTSEWVGSDTLVIKRRDLKVAIAAPARAVSQPTATDTSSEAQSGPGLQDIVVTARRREESLQNVPISITALSGKALEQRGVRNSFDLQFQTPSLTVTGVGLR